jgi:hypothetical protein
MGTRLEYRPFVLGEGTIALLGMHDSRGDIRVAEPPRRVVVAT